jgi:outer membrane protein assembly factor BamB
VHYPRHNAFDMISGMLPRRIAAAATLSVALFLAHPSASFSAPDWGMYGHDAQHTGRSPFLGPPGPTLPTVAWSFTPPGPQESTSVLGSAAVSGPDPASGNRRTVFIGGDDSFIRAFDAATGAHLWAVETCGGMDTIESAAALHDGTVVYVSDSCGSLLALNATNGVKVWSFATSGLVYSSPLVTLDASGALFLAFGSDDGTIYALHGDGTVRWMAPTSPNGEVSSSPAMSPDGKVLFVGSGDHGIYAFNASNGARLWRDNTTSYVFSSPAVGFAGPNGTLPTVFIGTTDRRLVALDAGTGNVRWQYNAAAGVYASPALAADGTVYIGSDSGAMTALTGSDGTVRWSFPTGAFIVSSPTLDAAGNVYFGSYDGHVYGLSSAGTKLWAFPAGNAVHSTLALGGDGTLYFGTFVNGRRRGGRGGGGVGATGGPGKIIALRAA